MNDHNQAKTPPWQSAQNAAEIDALIGALEAVLCARFIEEQIQLGHAERHDHTMTMDDALAEARVVLEASKERIRRWQQARALLSLRRQG